MIYGMAVGRALIAATLVVASACSPGSRFSRVGLGEQVTTGEGNVVTVYGWVRPSSGGEAANPMSGLDLRSCRTRRDGLLLDAGGFTVQTARGNVLVGNGSRLTAEGSDCVRGQIFFDVPAGEEPEFAQYRTGRKLIRWSLSDAGSPG